ncbi:hypothetical protein [Sphingomonas chungangi]|uniref:hypothetical protein n=1 Tax=Sphingomonas chungangi TaxID=2683589 RepID=UPI0015ECB6C7|nr:hypothetical protein [Sphingomonas chungangi]
MQTSEALIGYHEPADVPERLMKKPRQPPRTPKRRKPVRKREGRGFALPPTDPAAHVQREVSRRDSADEESRMKNYGLSQIDRR